jgi:sugar O-acyltransferase (sialic acid O-acetyltransferase NeuD family)
MQNIILLGAGGHLRSVIDVIESNDEYKIVGIIDNNLKIGTKILKYEVIGNDNDLKKLRQNIRYAFIAIGHIKTNHTRKKLFNLLKSFDYILPTIISKYAYVSQYATIDEGSIIHHGAIINANAKIGKNCIINSKALIEHDATINNHTHISTGALINGGVVVKEDSFIGSGSVIQEYATIPKNSFIKANSIYKRML